MRSNHRLSIIVTLLLKGAPVTIGNVWKIVNVLLAFYVLPVVVETERS